MRREDAVDEQRRAETRAQRDHHLHPLTADRREPVHRRVVRHARTRTEEVRQPRAQLESLERPALRRGKREHDVPMHDPRNADRDAIVSRHLRRHPLDQPKQLRRGEPLGGLLPKLAARHAASLVEQRAFDPRPADVDGERTLPGSAGCRCHGCGWKCKPCARRRTAPATKRATTSRASPARAAARRSDRSRD